MVGREFGDGIRADILLAAPPADEYLLGVATRAIEHGGIDPLVVYGTLCVKCPLSDPALASPVCVERLLTEIAIVEPRCIVVMGEPALECLNEIGVPMARSIGARPGEVQPLTPTIDAIFTPDVDQSLDSEGAKRDFWRAFRALGEWYEDLPPY